MGGKIPKTTSGMPYPENLKPIGHPGAGPNWFSPIPCEPCACGCPNHSGCSVTAFNRDAFMQIIDRRRKANK
jgi:hypothetical protein